MVFVPVHVVTVASKHATCNKPVASNVVLPAKLKKAIRQNGVSHRKLDQYVFLHS
jgi:hypothetical protein